MVEKLSRDELAILYRGGKRNPSIQHILSQESKGFRLEFEEIDYVQSIYHMYQRDKMHNTRNFRESISELTGMLPNDVHEVILQNDIMVVIPPEKSKNEI